MRRMLIVLLAATPAVWLHLAAPRAQGAQQAPAATDAARAGCEALLHVRNLTLTYAGLAETDGVSYCYVKGILPPAIHFHVQLPLPRDWNGRFLKWGDGGKDGDLDFADHRVAAGYAVANSNTGHDNGAEPGSSFAHDNRQAEIDFGDVAAARDRARLFMAPGMNHCRGGAGPDTWDRLAPIVDWVERGIAPDALVATHATGGVVDNERPICAFPERAVYTGPAGGADDPANWVAGNFTCQ